MSKIKKMLTCEDYRGMNFQFPLKKELEEEYNRYIDHMDECKDCSYWNLSQKIIERGGNPAEYCCPMLGEKVTYTCNQHPDPWNCPDYIIIKTKKGNYGIPS